MIEFFLSDPVILVFSAIGLVATGWSIVRDTRSQQRSRAVARAVAEELLEIDLPRAA